MRSKRYERILEKLLYSNNLIAIDTETLGLHRTDQPFAISTCDQQGNEELFEWDVDPYNREVNVPKKDVKRFESLIRGKTLVFHNKSYDIQKLEMIGANLDWRKNSLDTSVISHVFHSKYHKMTQGRLKPLGVYYLGIPADDEQELRKAVSSARLIGDKLGWWTAENDRSDDHIARDYWTPKAVCTHAPEMLPTKEKKSFNKETASSHPWFHLCGTYAKQDTVRTMMLLLFFREIILRDWKKDDPRFDIMAREILLSDTIHDMLQCGIPSLPEKFPQELKRHKKEVVRSVKEMRKVLKDDSFNIESNIQFPEALYEKLKFPVVKLTEKARKPATDKDTIEHLYEWAKVRKKEKLNKRRIAFLDEVIRYKGHNRMVSDVQRFESKLIDNKAFASINQCGTHTTRMSSDFHNVKKPDDEKDIEGLRNMFGPQPGRRWFCIDYSQLQLRIFAYTANEQSMIEAFGKGYDFHAYIASCIFSKPVDEITSSERRIGKNVNFGFIFGASPRKIEITAGRSGLWGEVTSMFPSAHQLMERVKNHVRRNGYITTPHGYKLYVDKAHKGVNYIVQGTEGDIVKEGMLNSEHVLNKTKRIGMKHTKKFDGEIVFQVHDELIFDLPDLPSYELNDGSNLIEMIKYAMEQPGEDIGMITPVDVDTTTTDWSDTQEYELVL